MLIVNLRGTVRVRGSNGEDFTPRSKKARGLLALLMCSDEQSRPRVWIQDKLWSDRGQEQGAASLRQALTELRKTFGEYKHAVVTKNGSVQLNPNLVQRADSDLAASGGMELCEDLDIRDPEFEDWLRDFRLSDPQPVRTECHQAHRATLVIGCEPCFGATPSPILRMLKEEIVRSLLEIHDISIIDAGRVERPVHVPTGGPGLYLQLSSLPRREHQSVSARVESLSGGQTIWQSAAESIGDLDMDASFWKLAALAQHCVVRILNAFEDQAHSQDQSQLALGLANRGLRTLFGLRREDIRIGDELLAAAYELDPRGVYLSWRAFARSTARFEHLTDAFLDQLTGFDLHTAALRDDPLNSYVLVFAAQHGLMVERDPEFGHMLCDKAIGINPGNPMAWAIRSNILIQQGKVDLAIEAAERGLQLADGMPCRVSLSLSAVLSHMADHNYDMALRHGRFSQMLQNNCQAMRRFMYMLYTHLGSFDAASRQLSQIRLQEETFVPSDLLRNDYPTPTLQKLPIAEAVLHAA